MEQPEEIILKPSRWRVFIVNFLLLTLASSLGFLLRSLFDGNTTAIAYFLNNLLIFLGLFIGLSLVLVRNYHAYTVHVTAGALESSSGYFFKRAQILLKDLDYQKTAENFQRKIFLYRVIFSVQNEQLVFYEWFFHPSQVERLRQILRVT